jgi:hypothetical protein
MWLAALPILALRVCLRALAYSQALRALLVMWQKRQAFPALNVLVVTLPHFRKRLPDRRGCLRVLRLVSRVLLTCHPDRQQRLCQPCQRVALAVRKPGPRQNALGLTFAQRLVAVRLRRNV